MRPLPNALAAAERHVIQGTICQLHEAACQRGRGRQESPRSCRIRARRRNACVLRRNENRRRAPKVTVTRGWVSLCQKGVTSWLLFVLTISWLGSELKRAGGRAACSIARAPLRSMSDGALLEGGPGGGLLAELFTMVFSAALNWLLLPIVLIVASAHRRDLLHASGHDLFQGKGI